MTTETCQRNYKLFKCIAQSYNSFRKTQLCVLVNSEVPNLNFQLRVKGRVSRFLVKSFCAVFPSSRQCFISCQSACTAKLRVHHVIVFFTQSHASLLTVRQNFLRLNDMCNLQGPDLVENIPSTNW